jgi:hypothetical protein
MWLEIEASWEAQAQLAGTFHSSGSPPLDPTIFAFAGLPLDRCIPGQFSEYISRMSKNAEGIKAV